MKRWFVLHIVLAILPLHSMAQYQSLFFLNQDTLSLVQVKSSFLTSSNSIPLSFSTAFFRGSFLDDDMKHVTLQSLKSMNHFQFSSEFHVSYILPPQCKSDSVHCSKFFGGLSYQTHIFASIPKDAFRLALYGNAFTTIKPAFIFNARLSYLQFFKLYAGSTLTLDRNNNHCIAIAPFISFHQAPAEVQIEKAKISTASDTSQISALIRGSVHLGLPVETFGQSVGGGIDFSYCNNSLLKNHLLLLSVENFGVYQYQASTYYFQHDTMFQFSGIHLTNFNHIDSTLASFADSLETASGLLHDTISKTIMLPTRLVVEVLDAENERFGISGSISFYPFHHPMSVFECIPTYRITEKWKTGLPVSIGEASGLGAGIFTEYRHRSLYVSLSGKCGFSFFGKTALTGLAVFGRLAYKF